MLGIQVLHAERPDLSVVIWKSARAHGESEVLGDISIEFLVSLRGAVNSK